MSRAYRFDQGEYDARRLAVAQKPDRRLVAELDAKSERAGLCYFIGAPGEPLVKIGFSKDVHSRLDWLRSTTGQPLEILATARGGRAREAYYHRVFQDHALGNEWFARHPSLLAEIERLGAGA